MEKTPTPRKWVITILGFGFGLCFPITATFLWAIEKECTFYEAQTTYTNELIWIINLAPFILAGLFYFIGKKQDQIRLINSRLDFILQEKLDELEIKNEELEGIFKAFPDMLFHLDEYGIVQSFKTGAGDVPTPNGGWSGKNMADILPQNMEMFYKRAFDTVVNKKIVQTLQYSMNVGAEKKSFEARLIPAGKGILQIVRDITDQKRYLGQLQQKQGQMERQKGMNDLIVTYNHEINNPLTVAYASFILYEKTKKEEHLDIIKSSLKRIQDTVDKISNIQKVSPEEIPVKEYCGTTDMVNLKSLNISANKRDFGILIVDDEEMVADLMKDYFVNQGMKNIHIAKSGNEAISLLSKRDVDLVISDVVMASGSGIDLMNFISEGNLRTEVIFMSGYFNMTEDDAKALGAIALLEKPVDIEKLESILKVLVEQKEVLRRSA